MQDKYHLNYDDSSSEEDGVELDNYGITKMQKEINKALKAANTTSKEEEDKLKNEEIEYSFLAHELGVRILKSLEVNRHYYAFKQSILGDTRGITDDDIEKSIDEAFKSIKRKSAPQGLKRDLLSNKREVFKADSNFINFLDRDRRYFEGIYAERDKANFLKILYEKLKKRNEELGVERSVLPDAFMADLLEDYSITKYFAYGRLFGRSNARAIRNAQQNKNILGATNNKNNSIRFIQFPGIEFAVPEKQIIYTDNATRQDEVLSFSKYVSSLVQIESIKKSECRYKEETYFDKPAINISDKEIAAWILQTLKGEAHVWLGKLRGVNNFQKKSLAGFIGTMTHLLFGTEVFRSPSCIIIHQMALELVQRGNYSFEYLFGKVRKDGRKTVWEIEPALPVTRPGIMPSLRWINLNYSAAISYKYDKTTGKSIASGEERIKEVRSFIRAESKVLQDWFQLKGKEGVTILDKLLYTVEFCKEWYSVDLDTRQLLADFVISTLENDIDEEELEDLDAENLKDLIKIKENRQYKKIIGLKEVIALGEILAWYRDYNEAFLIIIRRGDYKEFIQQNYGALGLESILYEFCKQNIDMDEEDSESLELSDLATLVEVIDDYYGKEMIELCENGDIELSKLIGYYGGENKEAFLQIVGAKEPYFIKKSDVLEELIAAYNHDSKKLLSYLLGKEDNIVQGGASEIRRLIELYEKIYASYGNKDRRSDGEEIDIGAEVDNDDYDYHCLDLKYYSDDSQNPRGSSHDEHDYEEESDEELSPSSSDDEEMEITNDEIIDKIEEKLLLVIGAREEGCVIKISKSLFDHINISSVVRSYCTTTLGISSNYITSDEYDYRIIINQHALDILKRIREEKIDNSIGI